MNIAFRQEQRYIGAFGVAFVMLPVCTENPIRIDWGRESPNVGAR